jgi:hypothetical protein
MRRGTCNGRRSPKARAVSLFYRVHLIGVCWLLRQVVAYFMAHAPRGFFPLLNGGELAMSIALSSSISGSLAAANGASIGYARRRLRPPYRRAGPDHHRLRQWGRSSGSPCSERLCLLMGGGPGVRHCQGRSNRRPVPPCMCSPDLRRNCYRSCRTEDASMRGDQEARCGLGNYPLV